MPHNFTRPNLPYINTSLPNDNRFQVLTRVLRSPPTDVIYDSEYNYIIDALNLLDQDIIGVSAGNIPGSSTPSNANHLLITDGAGNLSWTLVRNINVQDASIAGSKLINSSVTALQIADGSITAQKIASKTVTQGKMADDSIGTNEIQNEAIETDKISDEAVTADKIANKTITSAEIADNTITDNNILGPISVPKGGTGLSTLTTPYGLICAGTTATGNLQNIGTGTLGQVATSGGPNNPVIWSTPSQPSLKANQIAGSATNLYVNPAVQQFHQSSVKAWLCIQGDGTILSSYNIASVTRLQVGRYRITMTSPMSSEHYAIAPSVMSLTSNIMVQLFAELPTTTTFALECLVPNTVVSIDPTLLTCQVCGNQ